ncbi:uncharacterized protein [Aegilops tauschii subsp. strangulata]|uniref:uncharacterized protein n=1 Tax=Aegilops tauschii subsp. strangulata TaxID=200361 RepID=UPI003CC85816
MMNLASLHDIPWICLGGFNEVLRQDEHDGIGTRSQSQIQSFRDAVDVCGLLDLGFTGRMWTFEKKVVGGSYTRVRLDRALATADWCAQFPSVVVEHLSAATSDHSPILVQLAPQVPKKIQKRFRYEVMRDNHDELKPTVRSAWESEGHNLTVSEVRAKLVALANNLGDWSKTMFGSVRGEIRRLKKELERLRSEVPRAGPTHAETKINDRLIELYLREELMWRQRSRVEWLSAGDRKYSLFSYASINEAEEEFD